MPMKPLSQSLSPAVGDLGLGGMLQDQVAGETEEQRKKRMAELQQQSMMGGMGSMAVTSLFGGGMRGSGY